MKKHLALVVLPLAIVAILFSLTQSTFARTTVTGDLAGTVTDPSSRSDLTLSCVNFALVLLVS
jgi:hypothetical protein